MKVVNQIWNKIVRKLASKEPEKKVRINKMIMFYKIRTWLIEIQKICGVGTKNLKEKWEVILDLIKFRRCQKRVMSFKTNQVCRIKIYNRIKRLNLPLHPRNYQYKKEYRLQDWKENKNYTNKRNILLPMY